MRERLRRLLRNDKVFYVLNTAFWLGLLIFAMSSPLRMLITGLVIALVGSVYLLYCAISPRVTRGMEHAKLTRWLAGICGSGLALFVLAMTVSTLEEGIPTHKRTVQQAIDAVTRGYTTQLYLSDHNLREVPPEVWKLEHLTMLDLADNRLKSLPPEIGKLKNLETLYLYDNKLETLPPEIGNLAHLESLDLDGNRLKALPPEFARLQALEVLKLQYNRFTTFPDVIMELPNLDLLALSGNHLGELPDVIRRRAKAEEIKLWYEPNAMRFGGVSAFVIGVTFVLPTAMSMGMTHLWTRREQAQEQAAQQAGAEVFAIPGRYRSQLLFVVFASSAINLFVFAAGLNSVHTGISMQAAVGIPLLFSPLIAGCLALLLHNSGAVELNSEGVLLRRPGRRRFLRYADIIEVQAHSNLFRPALLIHGAECSLRIPRTTHNLARLHALLSHRAPTRG